MTERLVVCGVGAGMSRSLPELHAPDVQLVVVSDRHDEWTERARAVPVHADPTDLDAVLAALDAAGMTTAAGVFSLGCDNLPVISGLAGHFGCPGLPVPVALDCTMRHRRIELLRRAGLDTPRFAVVAGPAAVRRAVAELGLPLVVKPADRGGSVGVAKATTEAAALELAARAKRLSPSGLVLVEEFLTGTGCKLAAFCADGRLHPFGFVDRDYPEQERFFPHCHESGQSYPSSLPRELVAKAMAVTRTAALALRLDPAVIDADLLVTADGRVVLLEITGRIAGSRIATEVMRLATGVDPLPNLVRLALGQPLALDELRPVWHEPVVQRFRPPTPGVVEWTGELSAHPTDARVQDLFWGMDLLPGQDLHAYLGGAEVLAGVIATGADRAEAERVAAAALADLPLRIRRTAS
ncbi:MULTISPECIES: hypothetical protein [unclassified Crossiella]|uniref:ATP-grasp domain-containing protein n=1 Tax=unclassified Crossiella TaxID=2620835 RepID=UPI001FFF2993|nr:MULTISPECIES: hypothetical protein [unclassified Crossiella]MCK2244627.1 hypothetical protein [Crossiella sp. S99.2]MCK2258386.1 hypothetical protein [Crossiella sp. S99.1]